MKDHRARGLDAKYLGPYRVLRALHEDCEIESLETGKRKVVHWNSLRQFAYEAMPVDEEHKLLDESEDLDSENFVYIATEHRV